jgi:hypothetical protein
MREKTFPLSACSEQQRIAPCRRDAKRDVANRDDSLGAERRISVPAPRVSLET